MSKCQKVSYDVLRGFLKEKFNAKDSGIANVESAMAILDKFIAFVNEALSLIKNTSGDLDVTLWEKKFPTRKPVSISIRLDSITLGTGVCYHHFYPDYVHFIGGIEYSPEANDILKLMAVTYQNRDSFLGKVKSAAKEYALISVDSTDPSKALFETFEHMFKVDRKPFDVVLSSLMSEGYSASDLLWVLKKSFKGVVWED